MQKKSKLTLGRPPRRVPRQEGGTVSSADRADDDENDDKNWNHSYDHRDDRCSRGKGWEQQEDQEGNKVEIKYQYFAE